MKAALLLLLFLGLWTTPCSAKPGPLVIILLPGTSLRDWQSADAPNLHRLMAAGALAVMNTRTARLLNEKARETPESAALTLGAGARAAGWPRHGIFVGTSLPAVSYTRRMGQFAPIGLSVNAEWPSILRANNWRGYEIYLGNLADALAASGVTLTAGGGQFADLVACSHAGAVAPTTSPSMQRGTATVWDAGGNVQAADALLGRLAAQIEAQRGQIIVLSPFARDADYTKGRRLTPILEWGNGIPPGLIASPSTRRPGLVTNTDFAPSVAAYFGLKSQDFPMLPFGAAWNVIAAPNAARQVGALEGQAFRQSRGMQILPYMAIGLAVCLLLETALIQTGILPSFGWWLPLAALLAALLAGTAMQAAAGLIALILACGLTAWRWGDQNALTGLLAAIVGILIGDMTVGDPLMQSSLLGYSAVEGARFYGIGNEAMGLLVGSALVLAARLWPLGRSGRYLTLGMFVLSIGLLGSPHAGAKAGGLLVASAAFGTFLWSAAGGRWSWRVVTTIFSLAFGVLGLVALGDALFLSGHHSHIGEAVQRIQTGGVTEADDIIMRKLAVESHLAWRSAWACLLWGGLGSLVWLERRTPFKGSALNIAGVTALSACLLLNDAGVVAASLCLVPLWCAAAIPKKEAQPPKKLSSSEAGRLVSKSPDY